MRVTLPLILAATLTATGCAQISQSRINPFNWFGPSQSVPVTATGELRPLTPANRKTRVVDSRGAIATVSALVLERTSDGAIVRATGIASTLGQFNAQLVTVGRENGVLTLAFRIETAASSNVPTSAFARQVTVARQLSTAELQDIRTIRVQGATNTQSVSR
tara:strand:+ start:1658 stop:2143 length:486 start_codon:yes stop_codon:yes gene_type:complete